MALAREPEVRSILSGFEPALLEIVRGAWDDWMKSPHKAQLRYSRTRANLVHEFMVQRAIQAFDGDSDVHIIQQDETAKFLFQRQLLVRLKKGDANCLGCNIETQAVLAFTDPQLTIPGLPDVQKVEIVYVLNSIETEVDRVAVTARDNETRLWTYDIEDRHTAPVLPLPQPQEPPSQGGAVVRLRGTAAADARGNDDTNIG
jgi:hypothetical protein